MKGEGGGGGCRFMVEFESTRLEGETEARARCVGRGEKVLPPALRPLHGHSVDTDPGAGVARHPPALCTFRRAAQDYRAVGRGILSPWKVPCTEIRPGTRVWFVLKRAETGACGPEPHQAAEGRTRLSWERRRGRAERLAPGVSRSSRPKRVPGEPLSLQGA